MKLGSNLITKVARKSVKNRKQKHLANNLNKTAHLYLRYFHFHCFYQCAGYLNHEKRR